MKKLYILFTGNLLMLSPLISLAQWQVTAGPSGAGRISSLAVTGPNVLAGTLTGGIFYSADGGTNWTSGSGVTNFSEVKALAVDGANSFAGFYNSLSDTAVFYSADNGVTWSGKNIAGIFLWSLAAKPGYLIAGTWFGVQYSTNNGASWGGSSTGLPGNASVSALAFSGTKIFCGVAYSSSGGSGVFSSVNSGTSWNAFNNGWASPVIEALAVVGTDVFAGVSGGVYKSATTSANWSAANNGLTGSGKAFYVLGNTLFAGTTGGVFMTTNSGASWTDISYGLPVPNTVYSLAADNVYLYAGTDSMVWRRPLTEIITEINGNELPKTGVSVFPNPVTNELNVVTKEGDEAEIILYDITSRKLLHQFFIGAVSLNTADLEKGIYFYEVVEAGRIIRSGKVVRE